MLFVYVDLLILEKSEESSNSTLKQLEFPSGQEPLYSHVSFGEVSEVRELLRGSNKLGELSAKMGLVKRMSEKIKSKILTKLRIFFV